MRVVVERLARRLGYDIMAANIPEEHRKLLTHIRQEKTRKLRDDKAEKVNPLPPHHHHHHHPHVSFIGLCTHLPVKHPTM